MKFLKKVYNLDLFYKFVDIEICIHKFLWNYCYGNN